MGNRSAGLRCRFGRYNSFAGIAIVRCYLKILSTNCRGGNWMSTMTQKIIGEKELDALAIGANILGSGGGGDPAYDLLIAKECIREWGPVCLLSVEELDDQAWIAPIGYMGSPLVCL